MGLLSGCARIGVVLASEFTGPSNPIEKRWIQVKVRLRLVWAGAFDTLCDAVANALSSVDVFEC